MAKKNQLTTSDYLKYSEYERLLECLHNDGLYQWEMYARASFCTACRASDVMRFKWGDLLDKASITVTEQKTGKTRIIPLNTSVQKKFKELYELMGRPDRKDFILHNDREDHSITIQHINRMLKTMKRKYRLDIQHFSTHTFRKTFGRFVYESYNRSAESLILLNKIFKHTSIAITKAYIGITQDEISSVFNSIHF